MCCVHDVPHGPDTDRACHLCDPQAPIPVLPYFVPYTLLSSPVLLVFTLSLSITCPSLHSCPSIPHPIYCAHVHSLQPTPFLVHVPSLVYVWSMLSPLPIKKSSLVTSSFSPHLTLLFSYHCAVSWFFNMLVLKSQLDL